eukprot:747854-Hanusia_phi.AAC.2
MSDTQPLPKGWSSHQDPETGLFFYFNAETGKSQWERPAAQTSTTDAIAAHIIEQAKQAAGAKIANSISDAAHSKSSHVVTTSEKESRTGKLSAITNTFFKSSSTGPVWENSSFLDLFLDGCFPHKKHGIQKSFAKDATTLLMTTLADVTTEWRDSLDQLGVTSKIDSLIAIVKDFADLSSNVPTGSKNEQHALEYINGIVTRIKALPTKAFTFIPAGWADGKDDYSVLIVIERTSSDILNVAICNTGPEGLSYHPIRANVADSANMQYKMTMVFQDIPENKLTDSSFWFMLSRMLVWPNEENKAKLLYETFLPHLNLRPLMATQALNDKDDILNTGWTVPPQGGDPSFIHCILEACKFVLARQGLSHEQQLTWELFVRWHSCRQLGQELESAKHLDSSHARVCRYACKELASFCQKVTALPKNVLQREHVVAILGVCNSIEKRLEELDSPNSEFPALLDLTGENGVQAEYRPFNFFDGFVRDEDVEILAGPLDSEQQIFRPIQFTRIPDEVFELPDVVKALRELEHICLLLSNQGKQIRSMNLHLAVAVHHVFLRVLPIPVASQHPDCSKCIWQKPIRYETQVDILRLVHSISRFYAASIMSLPHTRTLEAARLLTLGSMVSISDAVLRKRALDFPSMLSLHFDAKAPLTAAFDQLPFGIDASAYVVVTEDMLLFAPEFCTCRSSILEYLTNVRSQVPDDHVLFPMEYYESDTNQNQHPCGSAQLMKQLCWEMGFLNDDLYLYVTGQKCEIVDFYPELAFYRDVVALFKFLTLNAPTGLPDVKQWTATDAKISWKLVDERFSAKIFGMDMKLTLPEGMQGTKKENFLVQLFRSSRPRSSIRGGADPTTLCGTRIESEEDVLHVRDLPTFGGKLSPTNAEILLSFLTVPYIRIPLVINFFASPENIRVLANAQMQEVLDSVMFEPSLWQPRDVHVIPDVVPAPDRSHLSTHCGLLFNELIKAPHGILTALQNMLKYALELDTGRWTNQSAAIILYVLRLLVRIEGFMIFLVRYNQDKQEAAIGPGWKCSVDGLEADQETLRQIEVERKKIREVVNQQARSILDRWISFAIKKNEMGKVAYLYAHCVFIWQNLDSEELTEDVVINFLSSQLFLATRFRSQTKDFSLGPQKRVKAEVDQADMFGSGLQSELFEIFQKQRGMIMAWVDADPARRNEVMEAIVRIVSLTTSASIDKSYAKSRFWRSMDGKNCLGRFVPCPNQRSPADQQQIEEQREFNRGREVGEIEVNIQLGTFSLNTSRLEGVDERISCFPEFEQMFGSEGQMAQCAAIKLTTRRLWYRLIGRRHDLVLWKPDERAPKIRFKRKYPESLNHSESWISEIWDQCRRDNDLLPGVQQIYLEDSYDSKAPFARLCGFQVITEDKSTVLREGELKKLGGTLLNKWNSRWFVLSGSQVCYYESQKEYTAGKSPKLSVKLTDIREVGEVTDAPNEFYILTNSGRTLHLRASHRSEKEEWIETLAPKTSLVEIVIFRAQRVVHIYNVVEHGRRFHRQLVFSSDWHFSMHEMPPLHPLETGGVYSKFSSAESNSEGKPAISRPVLAHESLVITRNLGTCPADVQTFVPAVLLKGLLPDAIIDEYTFWQNEDDSLTGYYKPEISQKMQTSFVLKIKLVRNSSRSDNAAAHVERYPLKHFVRSSQYPLIVAEQQWNEEKGLDYSSCEGFTLLNLCNSPEGSVMYRLAQMLSKMDNLSHCLVWTKATIPPGSESSSCTIDLIELPRLQLSFFSKVCSDGVTRLFSNSHAGLFISHHRDVHLNQIVRGLPHALVLESMEGEISIITPASLPFRRNYQNGKLISTDLIFNHRDDNLRLSCMSVRQYIYPVHISSMFLFTQTFASALNLLLLRFLNLQHTEVFKLADCCVSDTKLSPEEELLLSQLRFLEDDVFPDAHACRLKISLVTANSDITPPWDINAEMLHYLSKIEHVSAACRLSVEEELYLLQNHVTVSLNYKLANRQQFLRALTDCSSSLLLQYPSRANLQEEFDSVSDKSCLNSDQEGFLSKFENVSYKRPPDAIGTAAVACLNKWLSNGMKLKGGRDDLGFLFFYEMMTGTCNVKILGQDQTFNMASLMIRMLPDKEWKQHSLLMSVLRAFMRNSSLCVGMNAGDCPKIAPEQANSVFKMMFKGMDNPFSRICKEVQPYLQKKRDKIDWSYPFFDRIHLPSTTEIPVFSSLPRKLITTRVTDYACDSRTLKPTKKIKVGSSEIGLTQEDVKIFGGNPLLALGLDKLLSAQTRQEQGMPPVSDKLSFNLNKHEAARSHIATSMLHRLEDDAKCYAEQVYVPLLLLLVD